MDFFIFDETEKILLTVTAILFLIQLLYYTGIYSRIARRNKCERNQELHFTQE